MNITHSRQQLIQRISRLLVNAIAGALLFIFLYVSLIKLIDRVVFEQQLQQSPWRFLADNAFSVSIILPIIELGLAVLLFFTRTKRLGIILSVLLLTAFTIYLAILLLSGVTLPCTCGGFISAMSWGQHLVFNLTLIALGIAAVVWKPSKKHE